MKTVIEITREAGGFDATPKFLERFAELVRADERELLAAESERNGNTILAMQLRARSRNENSN